MTEINPVLLAGGSGTRLWPLSRKSHPKQFSSIIGDKTLFQNIALCLSESDLISFAKPMIVTHQDLHFTASRQLLEVGVESGPVFIEPESKNTAPAILAAAIFAVQNGIDPVLLISPCDHAISDPVAFHSVVAKGLPFVEKGRFVTFGIYPERAETGYGYLELETVDAREANRVINFIEKPDARTVRNFIESGRYLWNSGIFLFRASDMISAFEKHAPDLLKQVTLAVQNLREERKTIRVDPEAWAQCENISIDYAIMEKVDNLLAIPFLGGWCDLGGWDSIWQELKPDSNGIVCSKNSTSIDYSNVLLKSDNEAQHLVGLGLNNIIAVAMRDAVLVAHKDRAQDIAEVVKQLKEKSIPQAEVFPIDYRPWGWFETLTKAKPFQVKQIFIYPSATLSLQSHHHRSEHWIVVQGTAKVSINSAEKSIFEGESIHIPLGAVHRVENPGKVPLILIEVQMGCYLGEDDIIRYKDKYSRV